VTGGPREIVPGSLGILGGTFDPIHIAHLAIAQEAAEALGLERVVFVPAGEPPHKVGQAITPGHHRLAMVEIAVAGNDRFAVDRSELDRPGPSYTVDTLEMLAATDSASADERWLIISAEAFRGFASWRKPGRILELARLAVVPRDGYADAGSDVVATLGIAGAAGRVTLLEGPRLRLSATELRGRAAAGRSLRYLVPDAVAAYIGDHALYRTKRRDPRS
jgi:nicotinate-nucleotide adenylyltransferase